METTAGSVKTPPRGLAILAMVGPGLVWAGDTVSIDDIDTIIPSDRILITAYPNPFNPSTIITVENPQTDHVRIDIYDIQGRYVANDLSVN